MVVRHEVLQHERQAGIAGPYLERSKRNLDPERMIEFLIEAPLAPGIVRRQDRVLEGVVAQVQVEIVLQAGSLPDRKSTRLNSSHTVISYAVFCLKKKINRVITIMRNIDDALWT